MGKSVTSEVIRLTNVRLSYPKLEKAEKFDASNDKETPKFSATALLDPSNEEHARLIAILKKTAKELANEAFGEMPQGLKLCFGKGDNLDKVPEGYEGMVYVRLSNTTRPAVANRRGNPVAPGEDQWPYAGAYVNITCTLWVQNNKFGKRINGNLRGVQFVKDGEAFGQGPISVETEFEALDESGAGAVGGADDWDDDIPF